MCISKTAALQPCPCGCLAVTSSCASRRPKVLSSQDNAGEDCAVFLTPDGSIQEVMCADYGFRSGFGRLYQGGDGEIPKNFFQLVRGLHRRNGRWHSIATMRSCQLWSRRGRMRWHPSICWDTSGLHGAMTGVERLARSCCMHQAGQRSGNPCCWEEVKVQCAWHTCRAGQTSGRSSSSCGAPSATTNTRRSARPARPQALSRRCAIIGCPSTEPCL